jgi:uncharacterized protein (DUF3820 family)
MGYWGKYMISESSHSGGMFRKSPPASPRVNINTDDTGSSDNTGNTVLRFGKYRGRSISDIYETDPSYCKWLQPQEILIGDYPEIKSFLDEKLKNTDTSYIMSWGKYKGRTIKWIRGKDEGYIQWLLSNEFVHTNCKKLKAELLLLGETK